MPRTVLLLLLAACGVPTADNPVDPVAALFASIGDASRSAELADAVLSRAARQTADGPVSDRTFAPSPLSGEPLPDGTVPGGVEGRWGVHARVDVEVDDLRRLDGSDDVACLWADTGATITRAFDAGSTCWPDRLCRDATATTTLSAAGPLSGAWREAFTTVRLPDDGPEVDLWRAWRVDPGAAGFVLEVRGPDPDDADRSWITTAVWLDGTGDAEVPSLLDAFAVQRDARLDGRLACPHDGS